MSEDKLTHVLVPIEWIKEKQTFLDELNSISITSVKVMLYSLLKNEHINPSAQQSYIKQLKDCLNEIDIDLADLEDYAHGHESKRIYVMRNKIKQAIK